MPTRRRRRQRLQQQLRLSSPHQRLHRRWKIDFGLVLIIQFLMLLLVMMVHVTSLSISSSSSSSEKHLQLVPQFVGIDLGTSGARLSIVEPAASSSSLSRLGDSQNATTSSAYREVFSKAVAWNSDKCGPYDDAEAWVEAVEVLLGAAAAAAASSSDSGLERVTRICVSGTSASCLIANRYTLDSARPPRMYNYDICSNAATDNADPAAASRAAEQALKILELFVPSKHTARAKTGSLAKLLAWQCERPLQSHEVLCHQSDFVSSRLIYEGLPSPATQQKVLTSDWHNCLKLGYDVINDEWPSWMKTCLEGAGMSNPFGEQTNAIPLRIISPGDAMGTISPTVASRFGLSLDTIVVGGTTDSNAAFFAAAGAQPKIGTAVTSLGSTLAIKLLSQQYIEDADLGVYSHRFPSFSASSSSSRSYSSSSDFSSRSSPELQTQWLVGGASNVGCAIFRELKFSNTELDKLSQWIDPDADSPLSYYPLVKPGERFPTADSNKAPIIEPVPESRLEYLHGLLQSIARIERDGFRALYELGSPIPSIVWTCGGGSRNDVWTRMRQRILSANWEESSLSGDNIDASNVNCNDDMPSAPQLQVMRATNTEASYGAALLAAASYLAKGSE